MKHLILITVLLLSFCSNAQIIFNIGSPTQAQWHKSGVKLDSIFIPPIKDTIWPAAYVTLTKRAALVYKPTDSSYYFNNGSSWVKVLTQPKADGRYKSASYAPSSSEVLSALGGTPLFSEIDGSTSNEIQTISGSGNTVNLSSGGSYTIPKQSFDSLINIPLTFSPSAHTHPISQVIGLQDSLTGKENAFSKNSAFNKAFGTTAGTVAQGNDSRINNGQTAFGWGNHASAGYLTSEVDGSTTNEIELPSQSGQNGKLLSTNGTTTQWVSSASAPGTNNSAAYGTGTVYTLTTTSSKVDFGTTDPSITLPAAGTYLILANVKIEYAGLLTLLPTSVNFKLRRTNNTVADLSNATTQFNVPAISLTALTQTAGDTDLQPVIYTTTNSNDVIEVWGSRGANVSAGSIQVGEASIVAIRIY